MTDKSCIQFTVSFGHCRRTDRSLDGETGTRDNDNSLARVLAREARKIVVATATRPALPTEKLVFPDENARVLIIAAATLQ